MELLGLKAFLLIILQIQQAQLRAWVRTECLVPLGGNGVFLDQVSEPIEIPTHQMEMALQGHDEQAMGTQNVESSQILEFPMNDENQKPEPEVLLMDENIKPEPEVLPIMDEEKEPEEIHMDKEPEVPVIVENMNMKPGDPVVDANIVPAQPPIDEIMKPEEQVMSEHITPVEPVIDDEIKPEGPVIGEDMKPSEPIIAENMKPEEPLMDENLKPEEPIVDENIKPEEPLMDENLKPEEPIVDENIKPEEPLMDENLKPEGEDNHNEHEHDMTMNAENKPEGQEPELVCQETSKIDFEPGKTYRIESAKDKLVIDLKESVLMQRNAVIAFKRHKGKNQLWVARHSQAGLAFNLLTAVKINDTMKEAMTYDPYKNLTLLRHMTDGPSQRWYIGQQCGTYVQICSDASHSDVKCLAQSGSGTPLSLTHCSIQDRKQLWRLEVVEG